MKNLMGKRLVLLGTRKIDELSELIRKNEGISIHLDQHFIVTQWL